MGFFDKLFGKPDERAKSAGAETPPDLTPCKTFQELLERYVGIAFEKQLDFAEVIGTNGWDFDMDKGTISFGENLVFPVQILGTFSHSTQTWLWSWANVESGIPENITRQALQLRKYGNDNKIDRLTNDTFDFSTAELHLIGVVASGMFDSSGYYIADYGQGAMLATIKSDQVDKLRKDQHHRIFTVFAQLISQFDVNHKSALTNYLIAKGYTIAESENTITGTKNGNDVTGEFDELSRLTNLSGK